MENYKYCEIDFLDISSIHVMRESLRRLKDAVYPHLHDDQWLSVLDNTQWIRHIQVAVVRETAWP